MTTQPQTDTRLRGQPLVLAEVIWITVAVLTLGVFVANVPARYNHLLSEGPVTEVALMRLGLSLHFYAAYFVAFEVASMLVYAVVATVIFWRKSDDWMTVFVALTLLTYGAAVPTPMHALAWSEPGGGWLGLFVQALGSASFLVFFYLFLDGRFIPQWTRLLALIALAWAIAWPFFPAINPYTWPAPLPLVVLVAWYGTGVFAQIYRYRRVSTPEQRLQTKWVVFGITVAVLGDFVAHLPKYILPALAWPGYMTYQVTYLLYLFAHQPFFTLSQMLVPLTILISMARYRLWDIDLIIKRTLVYGLLTAIVVGIYAVVVGALGALFNGRGNFPLSILATGLVAVLFQPLRQRLQRAINRLLYGESDDPAAVLTQLGQRLAATLAPEAVLPTIVETVARALKLPYAAIALKEGDDFVIKASHSNDKVTRARGLGDKVNAHPVTVSPNHLVTFPLIYQSETLGHLLVAPRAPGEPFTPADRRLLEDLAHEAGAAAHAVRLTADLQRSREHLVTAREEERRRLRRDLHDGLGPTLASQALKLEAALDLLTGDPEVGSHPDPEAAHALLLELKAQTQTTVADIRRLVYELRPPALDELGLVSALREHVLHQIGSANGLRVAFEAPAEGLPPLSAAVEVAAYRIALEALTNVVRHAHAHQCTVRLGLANAGGPPPGLSLQLDIADDGVGLPCDAHAGVGLTSMRERAAELGGTCLVEARPEGGMRVVARLPLQI